MGSGASERRIPSGVGVRRPLGERLRSAREAQGTSLEQAARATRVPSRYLQMFEEGRYPLVSDPAYLTPFLRDYGAHLGLDPGEAVRDFLIETGAEEGGAAELPRTPRRAASRKSGASDRRFRFHGWAVYATMALAGVAVVFGAARFERALEPSLRGVFPRARQAPEPRLPTAASPRTDAAPLPAAEPPPALQLSHPPPDRPGVNPPYELRVTATARQVWVWVSIDGGPRRAVSLDRGESVTWNADQGYVLSVDDAGGIAVTLNGEPLPTLGPNSQALRDIVIPSPEFSPVG